MAMMSIRSGLVLLAAWSIGCSDDGSGRLRGGADATQADAALADAAPRSDARTPADAVPAGDALPSGDAASTRDGGPADAAQGDVLDTTDDDGDGLWNAVDNCPENANPQQSDQDADGAGDACDDDPQRFGHRLGAGALLLVGGGAMNDSLDLRGAGTTGKHTSANPLLRLSGGLMP